MTVRDLDAAARRLWDEHGLASIPGGRHRGLGTGNRIVPLGTEYLELMAVVDEYEARGSQLGRWVQTNTRAGDRLAALCLRVERLDDWVEMLDEPPVDMTRARPDGGVLAWRLGGFERMLERPPWPFLIEWAVAPERHPGRARAAHRAPAAGLAWVALAGADDDLRATFAGRGLELRWEDGEPGVAAAGVALRDGSTLVLRR
jgi:hypothetical protein